MKDLSWTDSLSRQITTGAELAPVAPGDPAWICGFRCGHYWGGYWGEAAPEVQKKRRNRKDYA
jgi:hypothetical protein